MLHSEISLHTVPKIGTINHLCKIIYYHFWNGKHWTFAPMSATLREVSDCSGFGKQEPPPFSLLAVATALLSWTAALWCIEVNNYPPSLNAPFRACAWRVRGTDGTRGTGREEATSEGGELSFFTCLMQEQWHSILQICSCGPHQFHKLIWTRYTVKQIQSSRTLKD